MRSAKSAKAKIVLGATLVAVTMPVMAGIDGGAVAGIDGGAVLGIDGGAVAGIDGGAVLGIDGGAVAGIDGGAVAGIDGGAALGIDGGAVAGIDGGAALGIDGGAVAGIDGGAVLGIDGGAVAGIDGGAVLGIDGGAVAGVGDFVSVAGSVVAPGWLYADDVSVSTELYVPGATEVLVTGWMSSVDSAQGTAQIGSLTIDYTSSLGSADAPSGAIWSFAGIRPVAQGIMLSDRSANR
jgi:hypothetical protein